MKKMFWIATTALALLAFTPGLAAQVRQDWKIKFKEFLLVWINKDVVTFDFTIDNTSGGGVLTDKTVAGKTYRLANLQNLGYCFSENTLNNYDPDDKTFKGTPTKPTTSATACYFAPTSVTNTRGVDYDVTYDDDANGQYDASADTDLLIIGLGIDHFVVSQIQRTTDAFPAGIKLQFFPGAVDSDGLGRVSDPSDAVAELDSNTSSINTQDKGWTGSNYGYYVYDCTDDPDDCELKPFIYLFPISHGLELTPWNLDFSTSGGYDSTTDDSSNVTTYEEDVTITYTVIAP